MKEGETIKIPLTLREHVELGRKLYQINLELIAIEAQLHGAYQLGSQAYQRAVRSAAAVEDLREELDNLLIREYREDYSPYIYNSGLSDEELGEKYIEYKEND